MAELTERRKADRLKMAEIVRALAVECGAKAEIVDKPYGDLSPQEIVVKIVAPGGLRLGVDFDGKSCQPDVHVLSWHVDSSKADACLADAFAHSLNRIHFHKATDVAYGFDALCDVLRRKLAMCADGTAYDPVRTAAAIAKYGTFEERNEAWARNKAERDRQRAAGGQ